MNGGAPGEASRRVGEQTTLKASAGRIWGMPLRDIGPIAPAQGNQNIPVLLLQAVCSFDRRLGTAVCLHLARCPGEAGNQVAGLEHNVRNHGVALHGR